MRQSCIFERAHPQLQLRMVESFYPVFFSAQHTRPDQVVRGSSGTATLSGQKQEKQNVIAQERGVGYRFRVAAESSWKHQALMCRLQKELPLALTCHELLRQKTLQALLWHARHRPRPYLQRGVSLVTAEEHASST